ncbi:MAG: acyl-[acyl-carrier-protein]--UDP-N-acetylglucosamine O-acyltransferase [Proteobacteria bacterium]|nr:MAG: acyl-[acyl-carrier-protein]--UDP-N-acetylglucosamine O-acyltransferase [Pseudomonadota bacterium]
MPRIHPAAVVDRGAKLADDVVVGAFAFVGAGVELDAGVVVSNHASVTGATRIGPRGRIHPFAAVGGDPQDKKYAGEPTRLEIGADARIHEGVTVHRGTPQGGGATRIGDDVMLMNGTHVAHDCQIGSHVVIASFSGLAGHVEIGDWAVLGAYTGVHQFARVGESVMTAANAKLSKDAPPFSLVAGDHARVVGLNRIGIERRGFSEQAMADLKHAFHLLFASKLRLADAVVRVRDEVGATPEVARLLDFLASSQRGVCR